GAGVIGLDYVPRASAAVAGLAAQEDVDLEFRAMNLCELRSVLAESARIARLPGRTVVTARHIADATDKVGRAHLWRAREMMLRGGGRLYLEVLTARGDDTFARDQRLRTLPVRQVAREAEGRGATVVHKRQLHQGRHTIGRLVVEWQR